MGPLKRYSLFATQETTSMRLIRSTTALFALAFTLSTFAHAQNTEAARSGFSEEDTLRVAKAVQHKLLSLTNYSVFDYLSFGIKGTTITLYGYASRPTLKSDAERAAKEVSGVTAVNNQIEVLPNSPNDDRIRVAVYNRIYGNAALRKYTGSPFALGGNNTLARAAGGITQDPPLGYHAIHIIVKNGNVILRGVVNNESDSTIAHMQANLTPGVFSVDNELAIAGEPSKQKE